MADRFEGFKIGAWLCVQRKYLLLGKLGGMKVALLDLRTPDWRDPKAVSQNDDWMAMLDHLKKFAILYGRFPGLYEEFLGNPVGNWFSTQKRYYVNGWFSDIHEWQLEALSRGGCAGSGGIPSDPASRNLMTMWDIYTKSDGCARRKARAQETKIAEEAEQRRLARDMYRASAENHVDLAVDDG